MRSLGIKSGRRNHGAGKSISHGNRNPLVLVIDVELLAQSNQENTARLTQCLVDRDRTTIVYTSETRSLNAIRVSERVLQLPHADAVIGEAGASVASRAENPGIAKLDRSLAHTWIGTDVIRARMRNIGHLVGRHSYETARRFSCFPCMGVSISEAKAAIEKECAGIGLGISVSVGNRIDISPAGVDTQTTLLRVLECLNAHPAWTVVASHLLGEELIARGGFWGIVTGEINASVKANLVH